MDIESYKIILVGPANSGKSTFFSRITGNDYILNYKYSATIGVDYGAIYVNDFRLKIWDTAGQERFSTIVSTYYRGVDMAILICDITDNNLEYKVKNWLDIIKEKSGDIPIILIKNKIDLKIKKYGF